ncbi:MAG: amino acid adenylation domain-containing protein, partial [Candidatus Aminicenantes bacterium]|nr:amino acid adenylation domain-containing protein [Candidatus Aminicenantes bacterium]
GILSILKTGAGYVPLNPKAPAERTKYILRECSVKKLLTTRAIFNKSEQLVEWPGQVIFLDDLASGGQGALFEKTAPWTPAKTFAENTAYVIFTSGSTGEPKGVPITHANFCPLMHWGNEFLGLGSQDRVVQNLSYYFDWSVWEIFIALTSGAGLYMVQEDVMLNSPAYMDFLNENKITALFITPTQFQSLTHSGAELSSLEHLAIGAEKLTLDLVRRAFGLVSEDCRVYNMYGPTEATIMAAVLEIDKTKFDFYERLSGIPIGPPIANNNLFILDRYNNPVPLEVPGELYIGGDSLSQGYLNHPELTSEKFIKGAAHPPSKGLGAFPSPLTPHPSPITLYRTGDLARWLVDGTVEFVGRIDFQVKIRGFRIEPGEIENRLLKHETVKEAFVMVRQLESGENYLCAYIVSCSKAQGACSEDMREYLSHSLPDYMIPAYFVFIERMPLNPNGKIDIKALPAAEVKSMKEYIPPRNQVEETLAETWAVVLKLDKRKIGIDDDFFALGGHSLSVTKLVGKIHKELDIEVPFPVVFDTPTIRGIAKYIEEEAKAKKYIEIIPVGKKEYYPISSAQKRFFVLQQMDPATTTYNIPGIMQLAGALKKDVFE